MVSTYLSGFSRHITHSPDILLAELTAVHRGLRMTIDMGLDDLICYSDSLLSINLISIDTSSYHTYVVLLQDIIDLLRNCNLTLHHTLRERNQCADYMAKDGSLLWRCFIMHPSPPVDDLLPLLKIDASHLLFWVLASFSVCCSFLYLLFSILALLL